MSGSDWLLPHEAAAMLHVNTRTLGLWARRGKVPCIVTMGGHRRYDRAVIERMVADQQRTPTHG